MALRSVAGTYELLVREPRVAAGYWGQPEQSRAAFTTDGWYRSGETGELVDREAPERAGCAPPAVSPMTPSWPTAPGRHQRNPRRSARPRRRSVARRDRSRR
ncbi:AMP-binding protein [Streptomyces sp. DASNCL29]|uniref:AMP-binding protein n=1 Tax=Streptomyces rhizosphaericus TaxID=114699 RepID=A0A6G4AIN3_9ACTN|nr:AMP-binding protein [Streptomyces rhizosphaericus]TMV00311.1 AMP-binding protein [Streptomyces sp. DASNCL29]